MASRRSSRRRKAKVNFRGLLKPALPWILGVLAAGAGTGWLGQSCAAGKAATTFADQKKALETERDGLKFEAATYKNQAGSWETRAMGAEAVAEKLRKAQRLTEAPEGAGVQTIKKGEVAQSDGLVLDLGLGSDCAELLKARSEEIGFKGKFDACQLELIPLKKSRRFWPTVKRGLPWILMGGAVGYALGK